MILIYISAPFDKTEIDLYCRRHINMQIQNVKTKEYKTCSVIFVFSRLGWAMK